PLVLAGPATRRDQYRHFEQRLGELRLPAQLLAKALQLAREIGVVDQSDERAAHLAARPGGDFGGDLALQRRHLRRLEARKPGGLCHARRMMADALLVVHFAIAGFIVAGLPLTWIGHGLGWNWVRNRAFRYLHL